MPQQDTGSFHINKDKILILIRLNLLQINHQVQILINVNGPVVTVKVPVIAPFHNTPARSRCNVQLHAVLIVGCLHAAGHCTGLLRLANRTDVIGCITLQYGLKVSGRVAVHIEAAYKSCPIVHRMTTITTSAATISSSAPITASPSSAVNTCLNRNHSQNFHLQHWNSCR